VVEPVETRGWSSVERVVELVETTGQVVELVEANPLSTRHSGPRKLSVATSSLMGMEPVADDLERQAVADALVSNHAALVESECRELVLAVQWADLHPTSSGTVLPGTEAVRRRRHPVRG
jgi:hypothetical protein